MSNMFAFYMGESLDLSHFDTSNVTNMQRMFYGSHVKSLNISGFDTSRVTNMSEMFYECGNLKKFGSF